MGDAAVRGRLRGHLLRQAGWCQDLASPLSARLLRAAADDVVASGPTWDVLRPYGHLSLRAAVPLRLLAGVHRLVLERRAPELARYYPSVGGAADPAGAPAAFLATIAAHADRLRDLVGLPLQTNEVGRCAPLLVGFLTVARAARLPLRLLEIGASAGLILRWDHYRYEQPDRGWSWGDPQSPLRIADMWRVPPAADPVTVRVIERRGCDPAPVDAATPDGRVTLTAAVWPDQAARHERLRAALAVAATVPATVDAANAADWLPAMLAEPVPGAATVVYQSVVGQYLAPADRDAVRATLEEAGARATTDAPVAWLRFEPDHSARFGIDLRSWPGGADRRLGSSGAHGADVAAKV